MTEQGALATERHALSVLADSTNQHDGGPPLRSLDQRIGGVGRLPHSTVGRVLAGRSTPDRALVLAFAKACGVRKADLAEWGKAWDRADADRRTTRARRSRPTADLHTHDRVTPRGRHPPSTGAGGPRHRW
ncbi:hypothetical protein [Streptomyces gardneri]|uniref:hypothetical protein n=1 Tax=Streptomyces gardneri TaxID=66892 RepID=UPI0035D7E25A